jgi:hypothetical protein
MAAISFMLHYWATEEPVRRFKKADWHSMPEAGDQP